jgi:hypothetical protein
MYMKGVTSSECDHCHLRHDDEVGVQCIAQGATGRFCAVLWFCGECSKGAAMYGKNLFDQCVSLEEAEGIAAKSNGWIDTVYPTSLGGA